MLSPGLRSVYRLYDFTKSQVIKDSARFIVGESLGESLGDPTADEILSLLRASEEGLTRNELTDHTTIWPPLSPSTIGEGAA